MPNRRQTPKRRRMDCPRCGRNVSYTHPWAASSSGGMVRDPSTVVFKDHHTPDGVPCTVNGPGGFGYRLVVMD